MSIFPKTFESLTFIKTLIKIPQIVFSPPKKRQKLAIGEWVNTMTQTFERKRFRFEQFFFNFGSKKDSQRVPTVLNIDDSLFTCE